MTAPDFSKNELIPAIIQDYYTQQVLMLAYMNQAAWEITVESKRATFFSRKRQVLWVKGETSGNFLEVKNISIDCDADTILIQAIPSGPVCHTGSATCFSETNKSSSVQFLEEVILNRKNDEKNQSSYTKTLLATGPKKIAQKVGEEAVELALEAVDTDDEAFLNEAADLLYHYLVLLQAKNYILDDVVQVLKKRNN